MCSVRRGPHFVSLISFSLAWGLLVFMLALPFTASAANVTYETVRVGPGQYAPSGVQTPITVNVKGPGVSKFHQIVPVATPSTIGKLGRSLVRGGGVGFAITGAIEGLGYLIDQATGDIKKVEFVTPDRLPADTSGYFYHTTFVPVGIGYPDPQSACINHHHDWLTFDTVVVQTDGKLSCRYRRTNGTADHYGITKHNTGLSCSAGTAWNGTYCEMTGEGVETIIDLDPSDYQRIDSQLNTALSLAEKTAILKHFLNQLAPSGTASTDNYPVSVSSSNSQLEQLYSDWPELRQSLQSLVNAALAEQLAASDPEFSPSPEEQTIVDQGLDTPPLAPDFELPAFCEWASFICEPFVGDDQPDVPMLDLEAPDYDSGLPSGGTCPPPYMFNTGFTGPMEISLQPACDLATAIRAPLIAISYLMAGFIVVGVRR